MHDRSDTALFAFFFGFLALLAFFGKKTENPLLHELDQLMQQNEVELEPFFETIGDDTFDAIHNKDFMRGCAWCKAIFPGLNPDDDEPQQQAAKREQLTWLMVSYGDSSTPILACCPSHMENYIMTGHSSAEISEP